MKFNQLIAEHRSRLDEADQPTATAQPEDPNIAPEQSKLPTSADPSPLTPEGQVFLVDLARKALAFNPERLPEFDRDVLGISVTPENASKVLKDIQRIVGTE